MTLIYLLLTGTVFILCLHLFRKYLRKHQIPPSLVNDNDMINEGIIPSRLYGTIAIDYQEREDYRMSSFINSIFVEGSTEPMWCLTVHLFSKRMHTTFDVVYDHTGEIYQY